MKEDFLKSIPKRFRNSLEYASPYKLRKNGQNYFLITTQDLILKKLQSEVRNGKLTTFKYREFEVSYLHTEYGIRYSDRTYEFLYRKSYRNKF